MEKEPLAVQLQGAAIRALDRDPDEADMLRTAAEFVEQASVPDYLVIPLADVRPSLCVALIAAFAEERTWAEGDWLIQVNRIINMLKTFRATLG